MHKFKSKNIDDADRNKILNIANEIFTSHSWYYFLQNINLNIYCCKVCNIMYLYNIYSGFVYDINNRIRSYPSKQRLLDDLNKTTCAEFIIKNIIE